MKCNFIEVAQQSAHHCTIEGRLSYKKNSPQSYRYQPVYKERWFRLVKNQLYYFKISETGTFDVKNPIGVFVMENSIVQLEHKDNFSFSITFKDDLDKCHLFTARSEDNAMQWVTQLQQCSYEFLRSQLHSLQSKIYAITGKDPLLLVPRNDGACLWAPSIPFSTTPACSNNTASFNCHLHTNSAFTIERSKSDAQTYKLVNDNLKSKATFYTNLSDANGSRQNFALEKSRTSTSCNDRLDLMSFDNIPKYSRTAPSPPIRSKQMKNRHVNENEIKISSCRDITEGVLGMPIPPKRKVSPVPSNVPAILTSTHKDENNHKDDLITF